MNQNIKASAIMAKALTLLWTGEGHKESSWWGSGKEKFGCHAVEKAFEILAGVPENVARHNETVVAIKARISTYIGGWDTAYGYVDLVLKAPCGVIDMQIFRKKMLEDILAEYLKEEEPKAVEILELAATFLWDGKDDSEDDSQSPKWKCQFVCHTITRAYLQLKGIVHGSDGYWPTFVRAERAEVVAALHANVTQHIGGHSTAGSYLSRRDKEFPSDLKAQTFRKELLEAVIEEYKGKAINLPAQIQILELVLRDRLDGTNDSVFVCDNVSHALTSNREAKDAIRKDIAKRINNKFGVEEYLGLPGITFHNPLTGEYDPKGNVTEEAKAFRIQMIQELLTRYRAELAVLA
jgi:hypothetical protein